MVKNLHILAILARGLCKVDHKMHFKEKRNCMLKAYLNFVCVLGLRGKGKEYKINNSWYRYNLLKKGKDAVVTRTRYDAKF